MSLTLDGSSGGDLDQEEIHDILRNRRRRLVIDSLNEVDGPLNVRDLAERIGAIEADQDPPPRNVKQSVYVSLLQTHLPKLNELGIVDYESDRKTVQVANRMDEVTIFLETVPKYGISWAEFYTGVSVLGLLTALAAHIGAPVFGAISPVLWTSGFLLLIMLAGTYQVLRQGKTFVSRLMD